MVTFVRRYAGAGLCRAAGGTSIITGCRPREMLDGPRMAETTPGPLIMDAAVRRLPWPRFAIPARCRRCWRPRSGWLLATWVNLHRPCFLWIFSASPFGRDPARQQGAGGRADPRSHRRWSVGVILISRSGSRCTPVFRETSRCGRSGCHSICRDIERRCSRARPGHRSCDRDLPLQHGQLTVLAGPPAPRALLLRLAGLI